MSFESFNQPEENKSEKQPSKTGHLARRIVTGVALAGGLLSANSEKTEAQSVHIPGTDKAVTLTNPFRKHEAPKQVEKILSEEDKAKIATVLEKYTVDKQNDSTYLVTDKKTHNSFPLIATGNEEVSLNDVLISLYNGDLSTQQALDNERKLEKEGVLEGKPHNSPESEIVTE